MLANYQSHLIATELFPEDVDTFRFNLIARKYCVSFVNHPDTIISISSTGDITNTLPANTGLSEKFKSDCSPADSFKNSNKRDASLFTTLRKENIAILEAGTPSPLLDHMT